jgi:hypothetical protein
MISSRIASKVRQFFAAFWAFAPAEVQLGLMRQQDSALQMVYSNATNQRKNRLV